MTSYQRRKAEINKLENEVSTLKEELLAKGNVFFKDPRWLGVRSVIYGTVVNGKILVLKED